MGAGTVVGNVLYLPAKLVYGILGGIAGGAGWALTGGNTQVSNTIWRSSLGGDYVLTPNMVAGQDPIHFSGPTTTASQPPLPQVDSSASGSSTAMATGANPLPPPSHPTSSSMGGAPRPVVGFIRSIMARAQSAADRRARRACRVPCRAPVSSRV